MKAEWAIAAVLAFGSFVATAAPTSEELAGFAGLVRPTRAAAAPLDGAGIASYSVSAQGYLRSFSAPPEHHFPPGPGDAVRSPTAVARDFVMRHGPLFGVAAPVIDFEELRTREGQGGRHYVRLQQLYRGLPVVAGEVIVQLSGENGIEAVLTDFSSEAPLEDNGRTPTWPFLPAEAATARVKESFAREAAPQQTQTGLPELRVFAPAVLDEPGIPQLVWDIEIFTTTPQTFRYRVLVDALDGTIARVWNLMPGALNRVIREYRPMPLGAGSCTSSQPIVRTEGQPPSGILEADNLYTFLGDTYLFYLFRHGCDSYDDQGATLEAIARYCNNCLQCPLANAYAGPPMLFGENWAVDDVVAHEFTHNVTASESGLIYTNASGAINESFSDIWGEFVDQTNGHGADDPEVRWLIGEELVLATLRNMKDPRQYNQPDRRFSPLYQQPTNTWDEGGVHINSGVCNKLCYLLTDGGFFNGQSVYGFGIPRVSALFYEVQVNLLTSGAGWDELYQALRRATFNLGWNKTDQANFYRACVAVEIAGVPANLYVDKFSTCPTPVGLPSCSFPGIGPFVTVSQGLNAAGPADILHVRAGNYHELLTINQLVTIRADSGWVSIGKPWNADQ